MLTHPAIYSALNILDLCVVLLVKDVPRLDGYGKL